METKQILALIDQFGDIAVFLILIAVGYFAGSIAEKRHFASINRRESSLVTLPVTTTQTVEDEKHVEKTVFVTGCCVISQDYFKKIAAALKTIFGGRLISYETLVDRGRREAVLRMKQTAKKSGCDAIYNMRLETAPVGSKTGQGIGCIEVIAYGTGVIYKK